MAKLSVKEFDYFCAIKQHCADILPPDSKSMKDRIYFTATGTKASFWEALNRQFAGYILWQAWDEPVDYRKAKAWEDRLRHEYEAKKDQGPLWDD